MKILFSVIIAAIAAVAMYLFSTQLSPWWSETITGWAFVVSILVVYGTFSDVYKNIKKAIKASRKRALKKAQDDSQTGA